MWRHLSMPRARSHRKGSSPQTLMGMMVIAGTLGAGAMVFGTDTMSSAMPGCDIKGNVSQNNGDRIFHVPGQKYYSATRIESRWGERWFCSEAEARAAGWRKSRV
jgi:hypothetical protein